MLDTKEKRIEEHRKFMENKATFYLKPLLIDILKEKPEEVLEFMTNWCKTKGIQLKNTKDPKNRQEIPVLVSTEPESPSPKISPSQIQDRPIEKADSPDLTSSEEEDEVDTEDEQARLDRIAAQKANNKKKMGISAEAYGNYNKPTEFKAPFIEKSSDQIEQIRKTLGMSFMFKSLDRADLEVVIGAMSVKEYQEGDFVIKQGDDGAELFIVGQGSLSCEKIFSANDAPTFLKNYQIGEVFGELALMYNVPRAATIISHGSSVCFSLDRDTFNNIVKGAAVKRRNMFEEFLTKIEILADLEEHERSKICDCLSIETFSKDEFVIREGDEGNKFYLVQEGTAIAVKVQNGEEVTVYEYSPNTYFGELALLNNEKRKASIRVTSDKLVVASLDKNSFKRMLGSVSKILERNSEKYQKYAAQIEK